jgi:hypothetical protein
VAPTASIAAAVAPAPPQVRPALGTTPPRKPLTLAEAVERWKKTKVVKPKGRN